MGYGTWWVVRWFFKLGTNQAKKNDSLRPGDLNLLEETTRRLMDDMKSAADECVTRIEQACLEAEHRLEVAQNGFIQLDDPAKMDTPSVIQSSPVIDLRAVAEAPKNLIQQTAVKQGQTVSSFARSNGLTTGEVELMRGLREYGKAVKN